LGEKVGEKLTRNRQMILEAIRLNPKISQRKLADILGIAPKNTETNFHYLKKHGYLNRVSSAKGGYWEVIQ
jgi:ATP-dependent DNA helicase RecG